MLFQKMFLCLKSVEPISVSFSGDLHPGFNKPRTQAMKAMKAMKAKAMKSMKSMKKAALEKMVLSLSVPQKWVWILF